jgi:hypothetical protein
MAERDAWWSIFLYEQYDEHSAVDRLVDWAWASNDKSHIEDESIRLCGVTLAWFLTTSHRFLRDRATKALVNLLTDRLAVLRALLEQFKTVNDLYVLERLLAVAYGCAMRSTDDEEIEALAQEIYNWLFSDGQPPAHILLRDYARGVIEYALHRGLSVSGDMNKIRPPYQSDWVEIPTEQEIEALKVPDGSWDSPGGGWAQNWIIHSVMGGDFARYVIGTNFKHSNWLRLSLDEPEWESAEDREERFFNSLDSEQRDAWETYDDAYLASLSGYEPATRIVTEEFVQSIDAREYPPDDQELDSGIAQGSLETHEDEIAQLEQEAALAEERFCQTLSAQQLATYRTEIEPTSKRPRSSEEAPWFDLSKIQRWVVKRVFDLGWTQHRFGLFDKHHGRSQRDGHKSERIGKKYQWLAYHEILARIADNFQFRAWMSRHADRRRYKGTWQLGVRDIDPSCVLRSKTDQDPVAAWWEPVSYDSWADPVGNEDWLHSEYDLPSPVSLIEVVDPRDGSCWLNLHGFYKWTQPTPFDQDRYAISRRDIFYLLQGYLVRESEIDSAYAWASQQDFCGRWMPEGRQFIDLYLGELYWSPAYEYHKDPYMGSLGWRRAGQRDKQEIPAPILPLSEKYLAEQGTFDCSIDDTYSIIVPVEHLTREMKLRWSGSEARFVDEAGQLTAFDPSTREPGSDVLLIRRDGFLEFLEEQDYAVFWTLLGEKKLMGGAMGPDDRKGILIISAAYQVVDGEISGGLSTTFLSPWRRDE